MATSQKLPFDIDEVMRRIRAAVAPYPKAVLFELADEGYNSLFEQLIACIISIRTYDEVTGPTARKLFQRARTPEEMLDLSAQEIEQIIRTCTFSDAKALQILEISRRIMEDYSGRLPADQAILLSFRGVGIKCANLALGIACGQPRISVDIHVHRITNRWGYVQTTTPEKTTSALEQKLPQEYWVEINRLLVPFGKHVCTGNLPKCSTCAVLNWCRQVGVSAHK